MRRLPSLGPSLRIAVLLPSIALAVLACGSEDQGRDPGKADSAGTTAPDTTGRTEPAPPSEDASRDGIYPLPQPATDGPVSLEEAVAGRRSVREYDNSPLSLEEVGQLLWATQGITSDTGARAAPSAGGTYPLEVYVAAGRVTGLPPGVYLYHPDGPELTRVAEGDVLASLAEACLGQEWVGDAAVDLVIAADYSRTTERYGDRGVRYVHMEAGHAAQNLCLQAIALELGAVTVGAFYDDEVAQIIRLPDEVKPLYVVPVGRPDS